MQTDPDRQEPFGRTRSKSTVLIGVLALAATVLGTVAGASGAAAAAGPQPDVPAQMLAAMHRDLGLDAGQARTRLRQEARAAQLQRALQPRLGGAYAGAYFDAADGRLVVAVTDEDSAAEARAAGSAATVVRHSTAHLQKVQGELDQLATTSPGSVPSAVNAWGIDPRSNSVVVTVDGTARDAATDAFLAGLRARHGDAVRVEQAPSAVRLASGDLLGGNRITTGGSSCSIGFSAVGPTGTGHLLTAGHCTRNGGTTTSGGVLVGAAGGSTFGEDGDYGKIDVTNPAWSLTPWVNTYGFAAEPVWVVQGSAVAPIGSSVCASGAASTVSFSCGEIKRFNQRVRSSGVFVGGMTETSVCRVQGDSGGSFISGFDAQGMLSSALQSCVTDLGNSWFQPVNEALDAYGLTLVTQ